MTRKELREWINDGCQVDQDGDFVVNSRAVYFDRFWICEALKDLLTDYDALEAIDKAAR